MPRKDNLMETMKRWITLLLVAALLLGIPMVSGEEISTDAIVQEEGDLIPEAPASNVEYTGIQVNPRFAHIISAADCQLPEFPSDSADAAEPMASYYFTSQAEAERQIRNYLKQRTAAITVYVKGPLNKTTKQTAHDMMNNAMAHTGKPKEGDYLLWHYSSWKAKITTVGSDYIYEYTVEYNTTAQQEQQVDNAVQSLIWQLGVSYKSDYEKVKAVYDYICANITYDHTNPDTYKLKHTAYAAIIDKTAVCQGYALLFYRMMLELGVDCRLVAGIGNGGAHGWNIVKLDGVYYNVDSTWDAGLTDYNYFLVNTWNFLDHTRYLEYETWEFHDTYPMAEENYTPGQKGKADPYLLIGTCGDEALFLLKRDRTMEVYGEGEITSGSDYGWGFWENEITEALITEGITEIHGYAFYGMKNLTKVTFPETIRDIGPAAFRDCTMLAGVEFPNVPLTIGANAFFGCDSITSLSFPENLTGIQAYAFSGCSGLTRVEYPGNGTYVNGNVFEYCTSLREVIFPDGEYRIPSYAFRGCSSLTRVDFKTGLLSVDTYAFSNAGLTEVELPGSVSNLGSRAFEYCENLTRAVIPGSIKTLKAAFYYCPALEEVVIGEGVETIATYAFAGCGFLEEISIPKTVKTIERAAFEGCKNLRMFRFAGDVPAFSKETFNSVNATAYYPAGNPTWTEDKLQNYGGNITWMPFDSRVDLNGDLVVDDGDVEVLLWHTLFPEAYPISINADLTKDGQVDDADVEFLLWHVLFPDAYPIN